MAGNQVENLIRSELGRAPLRAASEKRTEYVDNAPINEILNRYRLVADQDYLAVLNKRTTQRKELFEYLGRNVKRVAKGALYVGIAAAAIGTGYGMFVSHQTPTEVITEGLGLVKDAAAFIGEQFSKVGDKISTVIHGPKDQPGKALFDVGGQEYALRDLTGIPEKMLIENRSEFIGESEGGVIYNAAKDIYESLGVDNPHEWAKNFTIDAAAPVIATVGPEGLATATKHPNVGEWKWAVGALSALAVRGVWNKLRPLQRLGNVWKTLFPGVAYNDLGAYERQELERLIKRVGKEARTPENRARVKRELETALEFQREKMKALREWDTQRLGIPEPQPQELAEGEIDFDQVPPPEPGPDNPFHHLLEEDEAAQAQPAVGAQPEEPEQPEPEPQQPQGVNMDVSPGMAALLQGMTPDQQDQLAQDLITAFQQRMMQAQQAVPPAAPVQPPAQSPAGAPPAPPPIPPGGSPDMQRLSDLTGGVLQTPADVDESGS